MNTASSLILVAISEAPARNAARQVLVERGYRVRLSATGTNALALMHREPMACAVLDARLGPAMVSEIMSGIHRGRPDFPILVVQGDPDIRSVVGAMAAGVREYLPGALEPAALASAVARVLGDHDLGHRPAGPFPEAALPKLEVTEHGERHSQQLAATAFDWLVRAMEAKDPHLAGHSLRVAELAASIATRLGRADWEVDEVRLAGRFHDIGMIAIGDGILNKAGRLTSEEYAEVKRHPILGHQLLSAYPDMGRVASYVRGHHERWDGAGYPDSLAGESIPWGARVLAAAETFDALTSNRAYRSASSVVEALEAMYQVAADATDPAVMRALQRVVCKRETLAFIHDDDTLAVERELLTAQGGVTIEEVRVA